MAGDDSVLERAEQRAAHSVGSRINGDGHKNKAQSQMTDGIVCCGLSPPSKGWAGSLRQGVGLPVRTWCVQPEGTPGHSEKGSQWSHTGVQLCILSRGLRSCYLPSRGGGHGLVTFCHQC